MPAEIPLENVARQALTVFLLGRQWRLTVWRQVGDGGWFVTVEQPPGTIIAAGRRLVPFADVLPPVSQVNFRPAAIRSSGVGPADLGAAPWGVTHRLIVTGA